MKANPCAHMQRNKSILNKPTCWISKPSGAHDSPPAPAFITARVWPLAAAPGHLALCAHLGQLPWSRGTGTTRRGPATQGRWWELVAAVAGASTKMKWPSHRINMHKPCHEPSFSDYLTMISHHLAITNINWPSLSAANHHASWRITDCQLLTLSCVNNYHWFNHLFRKRVLLIDY